MNSSWTRRAWVARQVHQATQVAAVLTLAPSLTHLGTALPVDATARAARLTVRAQRIDPGLLRALVQQALDAARAAGAHYADARLTRTVQHQLGGPQYRFQADVEEVGLGVRALVNGYWGFAACPFWEPDDIAQLAHDAVAQARQNATGTPRTVDMGQIPVVTGTWATPIARDPFSISIEEKRDFFLYWKDCAERAGLEYVQFGIGSYFQFVRQERVVGTSEGSLFTQTVYETEGKIEVQVPGSGSQAIFGGGPSLQVAGITVAAQGWELLLNAHIPEQFPRLREALGKQKTQQTRPATIGRYTVVCDGATMASLVNSTLGVATQLDRALGYEANASGTSFLDDPLAMVGHFHVAAPPVTVTANRSAPTQLATVKWDDEGVVPPACTLITDGVLTDFQTTREQAAWLAPYYQQQGRPVRSNGCAAAQDGLSITLQHPPNLALEPSPAPARLDDLVADVADGLLIEGGFAAQVDFQARNGLLFGSMRRITNGRLGDSVEGGAILFNTLDLWKRVVAVGGTSTQAVLGLTQYTNPLLGGWFPGGKGQPPQLTSHSVQAVAATITNQPLIEPAHKA